MVLSSKSMDTPQVYEKNRERSETQKKYSVLHRMNGRQEYESKMADRKFLSSPLKHY